MARSCEGFGIVPSQAAWLSMDEVLAVAQSGAVDPVILFLSDESRGGDAVIAQPDHHHGRGPERSPCCGTDQLGQCVPARSRAQAGRSRGERRAARQPPALSSPRRVSPPRGGRRRHLRARSLAAPRGGRCRDFQQRLDALRNPASARHPEGLPRVTRTTSRYALLGMEPSGHRSRVVADGAKLDCEPARNHRRRIRADDGTYPHHQFV